MTNSILPPREMYEGVSPFGLTFGRLFDDMLGRGNARGEDGERLLTPALDITEDEQAFVVTAELPGLGKEDVKIQLENGVLSISGEKKTITEAKGQSWHRAERRFGTFYRAVSMPRGVTGENAEAKFDNGVLTVRVPKREDVKPKAIKIQ
jgi:HSP20 family protein